MTLFHQSDKVFNRGRVEGMTSAEDVVTYDIRCVDSGELLGVPLSAVHDIPLTLTSHKICGIPCREEGIVKPVCIAFISNIYYCYLCNAWDFRS